MRGAIKLGAWASLLSATKPELRRPQRHTEQAASLGPLKTRCDEAPYYENYYRANDCTNEASLLARLIPAYGLTKVCCNEGSHNPEQGSQDDPTRFPLISGMKHSRNQPCHKSYYDGPDNAHFFPRCEELSVRLNVVIFNDFMILRRRLVTVISLHS